ncbi:hypothetical protein Ocin01_09506 [Orchesella cincta]|uniref:Uncharacterized protein n=1 Tax=Orchesella cincta TaxID=48709 RepID=A0A1D2MW61_ORCCI|nr:hypothetical protein Ocin01_09506 [Orchesella cincta]
MIPERFIVVFCIGLLSTTLAYQERTLPTASLGALTNLAQSLQLLSTGNQNAGATNNIFQQFPFQLPQLPLQNLVAWLNNTTQSFNQGKPGQPNGIKGLPSILGANGDIQKPRASFPPNPIYTTLPFNDLNLTEFASILDNLHQVLKPAPNQTNQEGSENTASDSNSTPPKPKSFGNANNSGSNTIYGDLNFLTLPQLLNLVGR